MTGPLILLAAGGTGGHLFPAEALAVALLARDCRVALVTDRRGAGFGGLAEVPVHRVQAASVGGGLGRRVLALGRIGLGLLQARRLLDRLKPAAVVGFGGYPSVPTLLAAALARLPTVLHEQNSVLGRANRVLAPRARAIATSFAETLGLKPADRRRAVVVGNPVRPAILALAARDYQAPAAAAPLRLLVTGGSQGARVFADVVPAAVAALPAPLRARLTVDQQCRPEDLERTRTAYAEAGVTAELAAFFPDMPDRLGRAHLAICRAGASTLAELCVAALPALLVPLPSAMDDHQTTNARSLERAGGAWVVPQPDFQPPALAQHLATLLGGGGRLAEAARAARSAAHPDAAERLAALVLDQIPDMRAAA